MATPDRLNGANVPDDSKKRKGFLSFLKMFYKNNIVHDTHRCIQINQESPIKKLDYCTNRVITSRYTAFNFIPKNLWEQFHKVSNIYFVVIAILQTLPNISTTNGVPTIAFPVTFVLLVNGLKDAYEDWKRHSADVSENGQFTVSIRPFSSTQNSALSLHQSGSLPEMCVLNYDTQTLIQTDPEHNVEITDILLNRTHLKPDGSITALDNSDEMLHEPVNDTLEEDLSIILGAALLEQKNTTMGDNFDTQQLLIDQTDNEPKEMSIDQFLDMGIITTTPWYDVKVGDLLLIRNRERFPADLVLLASNDKHGMIFIETASLDGETNLKLRQAHPKIFELFGNDIHHALSLSQHIKGELRCCGPSANLGFYEGTLHFNESLVTHDKSQIKQLPLTIPLTSNQLLLRGCRLRNTNWAIGVVVYTGKDTKILQNSISGIHKISKVEQFTNKVTYFIFALQVTLCTIATVTSRLLMEQLQELSYLGIPDNFGKEAFFRFFTWMVLFANMVPISLIVTMGMVKAIQGLFIAFDSDMYHSSSHTFAVARTTDLNEELGQIKHVFTDKTGTLTCNCMEFRKCCIRGISYGKGLTSIRRNVLRRSGLPVPDEPLPDIHDHRTPHVNFVDHLLKKQLLHSNNDYPDKDNIIDFFIHLAVNHSVLSEKVDDGSIYYSASSPDEGSLVYAANHFGIIFLDRTPTGIILDIFGTLTYIEYLASIEFSSQRKRSSVVCRIAENTELNWKEQFVLYCKGADSVIIPLLESKGLSDEEIKMLNIMEDYAIDGLRTLCIAKKNLDKIIVDEWLNEFKDACLKLVDRQQCIEDVAEKLEFNLELQGITGIEDKLQDGVGDTLESLISAGIKIWMLTGDKVETAINIGIATSLISPDTIQLTYQLDQLKNDIEHKKTMMHREIASKKTCLPEGSMISNDSIPIDMTLDNNVCLSTDFITERLSSDIQEIKQLLETSHLPLLNVPLTFWKKLYFFFHSAFLGFQPFPTDQALKNRDQMKQLSHSVAVIIDGDCLSEVLKPHRRELFIELCFLCSSIICCRATPCQKGAVVSLVKELKKEVTLAIGDGANDCNMIQSADVGVGLRGAEGLQAFNVSDYGISQFRFLKVLLLCHGRWCYRRLCRLVLYMFYKNLVLVLPIFYFGFFSFFSGQKIYYELVYQLYNVILTSIPVVLFGVIDQDVNKKLSLLFPELYQLGQNNYYFNTAVFFRWIIDAIFQSLILFCIPTLVFSSNKTFNDGGQVRDVIYMMRSSYNSLPCQSVGIYFIGQTIFFLVMLTVNIKLLLETELLTWVSWLGFSFSVFAWFVFMLLFSSWPAVGPDILGMLHAMAITPMFYFVVVATTIMGSSWNLIWKCIRRTFAPELHHELANIYQPTFLCNQVFQTDCLLASTICCLTKKKGRQFINNVIFQESNENPDIVYTKNKNEFDPSCKSETSFLHLRTTESKSRGYAFSEADTQAAILTRSQVN